MNFGATIIDFSIIGILIAGIWQFTSPKTARMGNFTAALALLMAFLLVLYRHGLIDPSLVVVSLIIGSLIGWIVAVKVNMIQIPSMVALQHGAGGVAAFLVSYVELVRDSSSIELAAKISGILGLIIGAATFSGSVVASGKLANKFRSTPTIFKRHNLYLLVLIAALAALGIFVGSTSDQQIIAITSALIITISIVLGIVFSIRIGGADMPVLISFLNATAGLAAALCGVIIQNRLLIACGATVASSGSILTHIMCKGMNRGLMNVFIGHGVKKITETKSKVIEKIDSRDSSQDFQSITSQFNSQDVVVNILKEANDIIIIPGYGMALAQAQFKVVELSKKLELLGKKVRFAIHPVAGRMPGHMNVLLAEAELDYDKLFELDEINEQFGNIDLALVVGACDVVNPAAIEQDNTPISGMPILMAHNAKNVAVCNLDARPGYSEVENPLYKLSKTTMLLGDAKETIGQLIEGLDSNKSSKNDKRASSSAKNDSENLSSILKEANNIIIIPGYGMALAQAQFQVVELSTKLESMGKTVKFAIHPVAGRMPGHMNVLLAEANLDYDKLFELEEINDEFKSCDLVVVVGACDVVNPAAIEQEDTPISGMPIFMAQESKNIIVCNYDQKPGYSGVPNPLYDISKTIMLLGDAKDSVQKLINKI